MLQEYLYKHVPFLLQQVGQNQREKLRYMNQYLSSAFDVRTPWKYTLLPSKRAIRTKFHWAFKQFRW